MAWDVRQTYYYLVCFATLLMVVIGVVQSVRAGVDLALPEEGYQPPIFEMHAQVQARFGMADSTYTREELQQMAHEEAARQARIMQRRALRQFLSSLAFVLVAAPIYFYHWRRVRRD